MGVCGQKKDRTLWTRVNVTHSPLHCELDAVALLQDLHQGLGVVLGGLLQADSLRQAVGQHTAGVLLDPVIRHRDQAALSHGLTCAWNTADLGESL